MSFRTATPAGIRTRRVLVVVQLALSLTLLVGAALMIRTFLTLRPWNPGFTTRDKLTASLRLQGARATNPAIFFDALLERVRSLPGVQGVTASSYLPVRKHGLATIQTGETAIEVFTGVVMPNYFEEMQIPVLRGRAFDARDGRGSPPVAIVNEAFVRRLGASRVARRVDGGDGPGSARRRRARSSASSGTRAAMGKTRARPGALRPVRARRRSRDEPDRALGEPVRPAAGDGHPPGRRSHLAAAPMAITPLAELLDTRVATWHFGAWLLGVFAAMALLLAAVGLTAAMAWWVTQRRRGDRRAHGARRECGRRSRMVVRQAAGLAAAGIVLGLAGAAASTRLIASWLYGVTPLDVPTFAWSAAGMLAVAIGASYIPVRRAARVDPLVALRAE